MEISRSDKFKKDYQKLPKNIQKRVEKQLFFLLKDLRYPSLRVKKLRGTTDVWEARVTKFYRFLFGITNNTILLISIGPHDEGLGKK